MARLRLNIRTDTEANWILNNPSLVENEPILIIGADDRRTLFIAPEVGRYADLTQEYNSFMTANDTIDEIVSITKNSRNVSVLTIGTSGDQADYIYGNFASFKAFIEGAPDGSTIFIKNGTFTLVSTDTINIANKKLVLSYGCIINASFSAYSGSIFTLSNGEVEGGTVNVTGTAFTGSGKLTNVSIPTTANITAFGGEINNSILLGATTIASFAKITNNKFGTLILNVKSFSSGNMINSLQGLANQSIVSINNIINTQGLSDTGNTINNTVISGWVV